MWDTSQYCWVVICKNRRFHDQGNLGFGHRILPLGETDAITPRPALSGPLAVRCDECGEEYSYEPAEVLRFEEGVPESFIPHSASPISISFDGSWQGHSLFLVKRQARSKGSARQTILQASLGRRAERQELRGGLGKFRRRYWSTPKKLD
jgi:hypothetical protein